MERVLDVVIAEQCRFKISENQELLNLWLLRDAEAWAGCPPVFRNGRHADHLSIPLQPKRHGEGAGCWRPHLTYGNGDRHFLAQLHVDELADLLRRYTDELGPRLVALLHRTTPEELDHVGYWVVTPPRAWTRRFVSGVEALAQRKLKTDRYALSNSFVTAQWHHLQECIRFRSALSLHSRWAKNHGQPLQVVHAEGTLDPLFVYYFPKAGGWFVGPHDMSKVIEELVPVLFGPRLHEAMFEIFRELQAACADVPSLIERCGPEAQRSTVGHALAR